MGKNTYAAIQNLDIYNSNGPFSKQQWQLMSLVERNQLYSFANHFLPTNFNDYIRRNCFINWNLLCV